MAVALKAYKELVTEWMSLETSEQRDAWFDYYETQLERLEESMSKREQAIAFGFLRLTKMRCAPVG